MKYPEILNIHLYKIIEFYKRLKRIYWNGSLSWRENNDLWHNDWCNRARDISNSGRKEEKFAIPHFNNKGDSVYVCSLRAAETVIS